jgi:hypothetical protein
MLCVVAKHGSGLTIKGYPPHNLRLVGLFLFPKTMTELAIEFLKTEPSMFGGPPSSPGVYGVFTRNAFGKQSAEHLLYIGSSYNIRKRMSNNNHPYKICYERLADEYTVVYTRCFETKDYVLVEKSLIEELRPFLNRQNKIKWL